VEHIQKTVIYYWITCGKCKHRWTSKGRLVKHTCPKCKTTKVAIESL
jgi:tRNA(Ile2) C34 agmatinyltransferase TiaS